jgi:sulfate adenylyltransferase
VSEPFVTRNVVETLVPPHGGTLVDLCASNERAAGLRAAARDWPSWDLTPRQLCDLELLFNGGFSPLRGFMDRTAYDSVCRDMRLPDGLLWPIPITLDVSEELGAALHAGARLALRDPEGSLLAAFTVTDVWKPDTIEEARAVYGTTSDQHPGVARLRERTGPYYVGGTLEGLQLPVHYDFRPLRSNPRELRAEFQRLGWQKIVAFQTRNPIHRAHYELMIRAVRETGANLLIHPAVGETMPGDLDHYTRVRCYQAIMGAFPPETAKLALLPLAMRMAGPREAVWHAIIRKNYGCTHLIVGRDHAGPGPEPRTFYEPYAAQELLGRYQDEIGIQMVASRRMVYVEGLDSYVPDDRATPGSPTRDISGSELRQRLFEGRDIPSWFTFPEVATELQRRHPPRQRQGFTVMFTGLPGAGKSTLANVLMMKFLEMGGRPVTLLDGDLVRKHLSSGLSFSKEDRNTNIRRIGFVASEITKNGGIAICAPIAPYDSVRKEVRTAIEAFGGFVLVHVATPLDVCERRDRKGLYAKARAGLIKDLTGVSDPYEPPADAEIVVDTTDITPDHATETLLQHLRREGFL